MKSHQTYDTAKAGILLHSYHLGTYEWEELVWGNEAEGRLGTLPTLAMFLLGHPLGKSVERIVTYNGASTGDGPPSGAYGKQFLLDRLDRLDRFGQLKRLLDGLSADEWVRFEQQLKGLVVGERAKNTMDEITQAAEFFRAEGVGVVVDIAAASHAPRCLKSVLAARYQGLVPREQIWLAMASETYFAGTTPDDVVIVEPLHRGDDPMRDYQPTLGALLKPYFGLSVEQKQAFHQYLERIKF